MGPLRKNKQPTQAAINPSPIMDSPQPIDPRMNVQQDGIRQDPGVELLHSFQQQNSPSMMNAMHIPASPPDTTWYTSHASTSASMQHPQVPLNTISSPYHSLAAPVPQIPMNSFQHPAQMNGYHSQSTPNEVNGFHSQPTPATHHSLDSSGSSNNGYSNHIMGYSDQGSTSGNGFSNTAESTASSRTSVHSMPDMPPIGQSNSMWESSSIDPTLQEMLNQPQAPSSFNDNADLDQFWSSSLFDFSGLFPNEQWSASPDFMRSDSPSTQDETPSEKLSQVWPTRPSRRKLGCCQPGYINCEVPADVAPSSSRKMSVEVCLAFLGR